MKAAKGDWCEKLIPFVPKPFRPAAKVVHHVGARMWDWWVSYWGYVIGITAWTVVVAYVVRP